VEWRGILGKVNTMLEQKFQLKKGGASWIRGLSMGVLWEEEHIDVVCPFLNSTTFLRTFFRFLARYTDFSKSLVSPDSLTFRPRRPHQPPTVPNQSDGFST